MESVAIPIGALSIVSHDDDRILGVPEVGEDCRQVRAMLCSGEDGGVFGFGGACHNAWDGGRHCVDGAVDSGRLEMVA
jgi:hypothetical protein